MKAHGIDGVKQNRRRFGKVARHLDSPTTPDHLGNDQVKAGTGEHRSKGSSCLTGVEQPLLERFSRRRGSDKSQGTRNWFETQRMKLDAEILEPRYLLWVSWIGRYDDPISMIESIDPLHGSHLVATSSWERKPARDK
jgi:hypothetical protein